MPAVLPVRHGNQVGTREVVGSHGGSVDEVVRDDVQARKVRLPKHIRVLFEYGFENIAVEFEGLVGGHEHGPDPPIEFQVQSHREKVGEHHLAKDRECPVLGRAAGQFLCVSYRRSRTRLSDTS